MRQLLKKTGYELRGFKRDEEVKGEIVSLSSKEILVDVGGKTAGTVARRELSHIQNLTSDLKVGEKITARVLLPEAEGGRPLLSIKDSLIKKIWQQLEKAEEEKKQVEVLARKSIHGGLLVEYKSLRGFIPQSQLDSQYASQAGHLLGRQIKVKVIEVKPSYNRLVLSQRMVTQKEEIKKLKKMARKIKEGETFEAEVTGIVSFGLFVNVNDLEGLVHISEIAWEKVEDPEDYYKVGDKIKVKVLGVDETQIRLNLSIKQLAKDPWDDIKKKYKKGEVVEGEVTRISSYGAFVGLEKAVEGLIHISNLPPDVSLEKGEKIKCVIEEVDPGERKISLSLLPKGKPVSYK